MTHTATMIKQQQQPRGVRQHHRQTKSDIVSVPLNVSQGPRHLPHHGSAHHQHNPPPRSLNSHVSRSDVTSPQTPARPVQNMSSKKKKRPRKAAAKDSGVELSPPQQNVQPVQEAARIQPQVTTPPMSKRIVADPAATATPTSPSGSPGRPVYAGPTFHQSPAPKNLPVPRFFSKSVPAPPVSGFQSMLDEDNSTDESDSSSTQENHLERLFKADREEKARRRLKAEDSSDNDSAVPESGNPNAFFGMEPDSPFRLSTPRTLSRPQMNRMVTEPPFSMDVEKEASRAAGLGPDPSQDKASDAALRAFIYQSPIAIQPGHSPVPHRMTADVSPSPTSRISTPNHYVHGSPTPQRRLNFHRAPTGPISPQTPPNRPQYNTVQNRTGPRPVHVQPEPVTPTRPMNKLFFNTHPRHPAPAPPAPCSQDVHDMEATLRMMLKLDANDRPGSVQMSPLPVRT